MKKKKKLSQDEMIKNLVRDYPVDALEFFNPEIEKRYGKPVRIDFYLQEVKKHSHYDRNLRNDLTIIYEFGNDKKVVVLKMSLKILIFLNTFSILIITKRKKLQIF
jgi:hypothetical protein